MTHREVLEALSGLLLALFVAMLSVHGGVQRPAADRRRPHGSESGYTWVVVATLLTMTASTPIWGKLADLFSKKLLVQTRAGDLLASAPRSRPSRPAWASLIAARAVQGLGVGGLTALVQVVIASIVSPRERGRYSGYIGAVFALATVSGPLIGGVIVDSPLGWRGCFFVGLPIAVARLRRAAEDPARARRSSARSASTTSAPLLITGGVSILLIWVSLAGHDFDWVVGHQRLDGRRSACCCSSPRS